jgi:hypothetical protein
MAEVGFHGSPGGLIELLVPAMPAAFTMNDCCWKKETKKKRVNSVVTAFAWTEVN